MEQVTPQGLRELAAEIVGSMELEDTRRASVALRHAADRLERLIAVAEAAKSVGHDAVANCGSFHEADCDCGVWRLESALAALEAADGP